MDFEDVRQKARMHPVVATVLTLVFGYFLTATLDRVLGLGAVPGGAGDSQSDVADSDHDGFADAADVCPTLDGPVDGCPDGDGDGVADRVDPCPVKHGDAGAGCPDSDADGITDDVDGCPSERGPPPRGCPVPTARYDAFAQIVKNGDAPTIDDFEGDYDPVQCIGGEGYRDGFSVNVYAISDPRDDSGIPRLPIEADGRYERVTGVVGIQDEDTGAQCVDEAEAECAGSRVWIEDENGADLWRARQVFADDPDPVRVTTSRFGRPQRIVFRQDSLARNSYDDCAGSSNPAWANLRFWYPE